MIERIFCGITRLKSAFSVFVSVTDIDLKLFQGLMLIETYTTLGNEELLKRLPPFLNLGESQSRSDESFLSTLTC